MGEATRNSIPKDKCSSVSVDKNEQQKANQKQSYSQGIREGIYWCLNAYFTQCSVSLMLLSIRWWLWKEFKNYIWNSLLRPEKNIQLSKRYARRFFPGENLFAGLSLKKEAEMPLTNLFLSCCNSKEYPPFVMCWYAFMWLCMYVCARVNVCVCVSFYRTSF